MEFNDKAMIALSVPDPELYAMPVQDDTTIPADDLHITLAYLGDVADISEEEKAAILDACQVLADTATAPESLFPASTGVFPPEPGTSEADVPTYASPSNPELFSSLREDLVTHLSARGVGHRVADKHPVFTPHVTLAYTPLGERPDVSHLPTPLPTRFSTLRVSFGPEDHTFELNTPVEGTPLPLTASVRAQLARLALRTESSEDYLTALYMRQTSVKATPVSTRAQAALNNVHAMVDPHYRSKDFDRIHTLTKRVGLEADPLRKTMHANRALALASKHVSATPNEARELAAMTASIRTIIADGNSSVARSLRARKQLRDRYGRWIEQGGGVRFKVRVPGAPGGGTWYHGIVQGFDIENSRVNVELEDGRVVKIPNTKIEQPKAILGLRTKISDKAKTFLPKSANRSNPELPQPLRQADPKTDELDTAAMSALDNIYEDSVDVASKTPGGGNVVRLAIDASNSADYEAAKAAGAPDFNYEGTVAPYKGEVVNLKTADIDAVRAAYDNRVNKSNQPVEGASEEEAKKTLQKAQSGAIGYLAGLFNDKHDEDAVALRKAPSVGTDQELEEVNPDEAAPKADLPDAMEMVDAVDNAFDKLFDLVPDDHPLSGARDQLNEAIQGANSRFVSNEDDEATYLKNLDAIKEFANDQEPAFVSPNAKSDPVAQAFGAFAEDIDDIHAAAEGVDEIDAVRSALADITSLVDNIEEEPQEYPDAVAEDVAQVVYGIEQGIKSGKYLNNTDGLAQDIDDALSTLSDNGLEDQDAYSSLKAAREPFGDVPEAPVPSERVPDTTPETPEGADAPAAAPSDWTPFTPEALDELKPGREDAYDEWSANGIGEDVVLPNGNHAMITHDKQNGNDTGGYNAGTYRVRIRKEFPTGMVEDEKVFKYDETPYGSQNGAMNQKAAKQALADFVNAKAEGLSTQKQADANLDAVNDYTDAPDDATDDEKQAFLKVQDVHGSLYDVLMGENGPIVASNNGTDAAIISLADSLADFEGEYMTANDAQRKTLVDNIYENATVAAEAFGSDNAFDSDKIQPFMDAATDLKATFGTPEDAPEVDAPETSAPTADAPGFSDFSDLNAKFNDFLVPYQEEDLPADAYDRAATAANTVANVGNDLQQGKIDAGEAVDLLANAVTDINDLLSADDDLADSEFGMDLDSLMGEVSNLQGKLSTDGFNPDEDAAEMPQAPEKAAGPAADTWDTLDPATQNEIDDAANNLVNWLAAKNNQLNAEPDFEDGQGAGYKLSVQPANDFAKMQNAFDDASIAYADGDLTHTEFADAMKKAADEWMNSDGFSELVGIGDADGSLAEEFDAEDALSAFLNAVPGIFPEDAKTNDPAPGDPWADVPSEPGRTTPWTAPSTVDEINVPSYPEAEAPLAEWEKELLMGFDDATMAVLEENAPEAVAPVQKLLNQLDETMKSDEAPSDKWEDLLDGANLYMDEIDSIQPADDNAAAALEGVKAPVETFVENLEANPIPDVDPQVEMSKLQGIIDSLNNQDGFIQKILANSLQEKLDNGEEISEADLAQVQQFLGTIAESENTTPEEKADYKLAEDALDVETAVPAEAPEVPEEAPSAPETLPEAPEAPAETPATLEESIAAWKSSLNDYLTSPAYTGSDPSAAMVHGSVHNPLNDKQVANIQNLVDTAGPGAMKIPDADKLQKALNAHKKAEISDDELIQAISSIADNYAFYSKVAGRLRGAQSGIQVNKPALVGVLRPKEEYYGNPDDLDATDFYMASPEVVQATLNKILEQSLAGADLEALLDSAAVGTDDAAVSQHIDNAKMYTSVALDALQAGNAEFMISNMRDALDEFDKAIALRAQTHKNDKVIRRLRARRRSLDETLAAFEGRWPDPVVGGNQQEKHGGFIIDNTVGMEDKNGDLVYPGDIIERTYGSAKGQLALTVATANQNGVPRALVQLDDHPDVYHNGLGNKSFVLSAVGPNNPLYSDPSYTGPKVESSPGTFGNLEDIQKTYTDNQAKKGKGTTAPTPTDESTPSAPETVEADVPAPIEPTPDPAAQPETVGSFSTGDTVQVYGAGMELMDGKIINFDSVGTPYEAATVELDNGDLQLVLLEWLEEEKAKNAKVPTPAEERAAKMQAEVFDTATAAGLEEIAKKVQVAGVDGLGVKGYNQTMMQLDEKYKLLTGGISIADVLANPEPEAAPETDGPTKPEGYDIMGDPDPVGTLKDLPVGSEVKTESYVSGLDYLTWTKGNDGYWKGQYDTTSSEGLIETSPYVVLTKDGEMDSEDVSEPFVFDPTTMVGEIMDLPDLDALNEYEGRLGDAFDNDEITESQYNAAMGIINYRRDQLENPGDGGNPPPADEPTPDVPPTPAPAAVPGQSVFQPLPDDQKGQDGDLWVTVNGQHKWGRYGAAGIAVTHTDADGKKYVLLGKRGDRDEWYLPGGALDEGESPIQGATREFIEEATEGADIAEMLSLVSTSEYDAGEIDNTDGEHWKYTTLIADLPDMVDVTVPPGSNPYELGEYKWVDADALQLLDDQGSLHAAMSNGRFAKLIGFQEGEAEPLQDATLAPDNLADVKYDMSGWINLGGAGGSNGAMRYKDENGNIFYAKPAQSEAHAHNEVLASALYSHFGINASKSALGTKSGKTYIVSPEVKGDQNGFTKLQTNPDFLAALQDGFAVDAWLGNYDVIGNSSWNVIADENGMPVRIDQGGSLLYRGTGSIKSWWGTKVMELNAMRQGSNKSGSFGNAKSVFGKMTEDQVAESAKKLLNISPAQIQEIVSSTGFAPDVQKSLIDTLIQRRHNILKQYNIADQPAMKQADDAKAIQNSLPVGVQSFNVGQKIKFKGENGATGVVKTVFPDGMVKVKQDGVEGYATMASIEDIEPANIPDAVAEGGKVFLFAQNGKNFAVGDKVYYLDGPSQEWVSGTLNDDGVQSGLDGQKFVKFTSDGGVVWGVETDKVVSEEAYNALPPVEVYDAPPAAIDDSSDLWASLGMGFATPPPGALVLKKMVKPFGTRAVVQHPDGKLYMYSNYGTGSGQAVTAYGQSANSYTPEKGWVDFHVQIPEFNAGNPSGKSMDEINDMFESNTPVEPIFAGSYKKVPEGSTILLHATGPELEPYVVKHPNGDMFIYYNDGDYLPLDQYGYEILADNEDWPVYTGPQTAPDYVAPVTPSGTVSDNSVLDLGTGYDTPPPGSKVLYKEVANTYYEAYLIEQPDGGVFIYWNDGTSGFYVDELPADFGENNNQWLKVGDNEQPVTEAPQVEEPAVVDADPNAPLSNSGLPVAVGQEVKIIKYAKKGRPKTGKVVKVSPDGAVRIKLLNDDGSVYLDDKGKAVYSIAAAQNIRQIDKPKVSAADLAQNGLPMGLLFSNPDTDNPLYGTEKPAPPTPPAQQQAPAVSDEWVQKADDLYKKRKLEKYPNDPNPKGVKESSYWNTYYAKVLQGSETDLKWLLDNNYIDQALFDEAKSQQAGYLAKQAELMAEFNVEYEAWQSKFAEWKKAQGGASVVPLAHNDPSVQSWSHDEAWANMNEQFADQKISGPASSGAGSQKSGGWQEHLRSIAQTVGLKKEDIAKQPNVSSGAMAIWEKLSGLGGLATNEGVKKPFRAIMTRRYWQFSDPNGNPYNSGSDLSSMKGTIQKDFGAMEMTPGSMEDGGKFGYKGSGYNVAVDLVVPAGIKGVWTGGGQWGFGGKTSEMGFIAESGLAMYIWDVETGNFSLGGTSGGSGNFTHKVKASLIPTELYPYMEYFEGNPDSHDVILPAEAQKIIDQYKQPLGLVEGTTSTNPFENTNDGTVGDNQ